MSYSSLCTLTHSITWARSNRGLLFAMPWSGATQLLAHVHNRLDRGFEVTTCARDTGETASEMVPGLPPQSAGSNETETGGHLSTCPTSTLTSQAEKGALSFPEEKGYWKGAVPTSRIAPLSAPPWEQDSQELPSQLFGGFLPPASPISSLQLVAPSGERSTRLLRRTTAQTQRK